MYNIHLDNAQVVGYSVSKIGNKAREEGVFKSKAVRTEMSSELQEFIMTHFLSKFKFDAMYEFCSDVHLSMNTVYNLCADVFSQGDLTLESVSLIEDFMYETSNHPSVKQGDLYILRIDNVVVDDELVDAIGIFKLDNKEVYVKTALEGSSLDFEFNEGSSSSIIDKGCLVFGLDKDTGYRVALFEPKRKWAKEHWRNRFLSVSQVHDSVFMTSNYMDMCKQFAKKHYKEETKIERAYFLSRLKDYFTHYKEFNEKEFLEVVFQDNYNALDAFEGYKDFFQEAKEIEDTADEGFYINEEVAKKTAGKINTKVQMDTRVELKVDSSLVESEDLIEHGYCEEREMQYYKVYFNNEK